MRVGCWLGFFAVLGLLVGPVVSAGVRLRPTGRTSASVGAPSINGYGPAFVELSNTRSSRADAGTTARDPVVSQLRGMLRQVEESQKAVGGLMKTFQSGIQRELVAESSAADQAKKLALQRNYQNTRERRLRTLALLRERERRSQVANCLNPLRGGRDAVYISLMNLFAETVTENLCPVLKAFKFPDLRKWGFDEPHYLKYNLGPVPKTDGSEVLFYTAVKENIWRCMCEEKPQPLKKTFKATQKLSIENQWEKAAEEASADVKAMLPNTGPAQ